MEKLVFHQEITKRSTKLIIDNTDGKVDYWFNYEKFQT